MKRSDGNFEITYYLEGDTITRTRVYDLFQKEVIPDNTVYHRQSQLDSDVQGALHQKSDANIIRAIGQPGTDAVEILSITDDFVLSCKSTNDYFVISRAKRIK